MSQINEKIALMRRRIEEIPRNRRGYRRLPAEVREEILSLYEESGLTIRELSQKLGLGSSTLRNWRTKSKPKKFKRLRVKTDPLVAAQSGSDELSVEVPSGLVIRGRSACVYGLLKQMGY